MRQVLASLALGVIMSQACAETPVTITKVWARATPPGSTVGVVYAQLTATSADEILSIATPLAEKAEIHVSTQEDGVAKMRRVERVTLPPGAPVRFAPGGYHVMLLGLREPLVAGQSLEVTFTFRAAGRVTARAQIVGPGENGPS